MLTNQQKLRYTSITALMLQVTTLVCGFILPKMYLTYYGSTVNGLVSSITQFLGFIALAECGVGAVVRSAFYKPLAQKDNYDLSLIVVSSDSFFRKIALLLLIYVVVLIAVYPFLVSDTFDFIYTESLIAIMSASFFAQYYFGMTSRLLLASDQFGFIFLSIQVISLLLNLVISIFLMKHGFSIHFVKLAASTIFVLQPIALYLFVKKKYNIDYTMKPRKDAIPQKWNGFAQHLAAIVLASSGVVILSIGAPITLVSVYSIYSLVVIGVKNLVDATTNGFMAYFGNLYALDKLDELKVEFSKFQWQMHSLVTIVFILTVVLITPFVAVYTANITDANYIVPTFGMLFSAAWGMYCYRLPYSIMVLAVGHYKQTQNSAIIEVVLNVSISVLFFYLWGLEGIALGIFISMIYRTVYFANYITQKIFQTSSSYWQKFFGVNVIVILVFGICYLALHDFLAATDVENFLDWTILALKNGITVVLISLLVNMFFFKDYTREFLNKFSKLNFFKKKTRP